MVVEASDLANLSATLLLHTLDFSSNAGKLSTHVLYLLALDARLFTSAVDVEALLTETTFKIGEFGAQLALNEILFTEFLFDTV